MLSLRLLANLFANPTGKALVCENVDEILLHLELFLETTNKGIQIALASVLLNYTVATSSRKDINTTGKLLSFLTKILSREIDSEAAFRALVAVGTLLVENSENARALTLSLETRNAVAPWCERDGPKKVGECARLLRELL
eukprot:m.265207 g.265207  ORF g.265207 m.265207 type:complete len:141 (+) comp40484_c0_seq11:1987-2409(+)